MTAVIVDPGDCLPYFPNATVIAPPDMPEDDWRALRHTGIGGSDILTLLRMSKYGGPLQLYLEKKGLYTRPDNKQLSTAARRGKRLESLVSELYAEETGHLVVGNPGTLAHIGEPWMRANLDYMVFDPDPAVLECKTRTWRSGKSEDWGGQEPPDGPTVQACWYLLVTGWKRAYIAGLVDDDFHWFKVERDEELLNHLATVARRFYFDHLLPGRPPKADGLDATTDLLQHLWDVKPGAVKLFDPSEIEPDLIERRRLKTEISTLKEKINTIENRLKMQLGDAEAAIAPDGRRLFSWIGNGGFAHARMAKQLPETAKAYTHLVETIDIPRIKEEDPALYQAFRSRVFRDATS